jgi:hypothetical protein
MSDESTSDEFNTIVQYSVAGGFEEAPCVEWAKGMYEASWLAALGVATLAEEEDGPQIQGQVVIHYRSEKAPGVWYAIVKFEGVNRCEWIAVKTRSDLMALRIALAPLVQVQWANEVVPFVMQTFRRAFEAWHGHAPHTWCPGCDREAAQEKFRHERERSQRLGKP